MFGKGARFAVRWRRAGWGLRLSIFAACLSLFVLLVVLQQSGSESSDSGGSFLVYSLVNINFILLLVFAFLIGRNIVRLVFDRKRNIFGSKLRSRLVGAFVSLVLIPSVFIFLFASGLITRVMEGWFSEPIEIAIAGAVDIAKTHFQVSKKYLQAVGDEIDKDLSPRLKSLISEKNSEQDTDRFRSELDRIRKNWGLFSLRLVKGDATAIAEVFNPTSTIESFAEPPLSLEFLKELEISGESKVSLEELESRQFLRGYQFIGDRAEKLILVTSLRISPEMSQTMANINSSYRRYEELKYYKSPLKSSNILTLALFTALLLFSAIWLAFYLARDLTGPMLRLAEATRSVAQGKYDFSLKEVGDDELGILVQSFNQMTAKLRETQLQSEQRRAYLEVVIGGLAVGVFSLDANMRLVSVNRPASQLLREESRNAAIGKVLWDVLPEELAASLSDLLSYKPDSASEPPKGFAVEKQFAFNSGGQRLELLATLAKIEGVAEELSGYVLLIDDLTDLARAQQSAAWREVAQRVAHEIKNPLTPIQISAQRLQRLSETFENNSPNKLKIEECCSAILENVNSIKKLTDEFRQYARMPTPEFVSCDLTPILAEVVQTYANGNSKIEFSFVSEQRLLSGMMDPEQIRRVLINLIDNAIQSLKCTSRNKPKIEVQAGMDATKQKIFFSVSDNGSGVKDDQKIKIFEPHVTTRPQGSGLGLAIVTSILNDHQGTIRVLDNKPEGAKFVVELPIHASHKTARKIV
jgi:two-component system nitrogen regulation sensor histidine kinase NtrY